MLLKNIYTNDKVYAFIVTKDKSNITIQELEEYWKANMKSYELPDYYIFIDNIPLTPM